MPDWLIVPDTTVFFGGSPSLLGTAWTVAEQLCEDGIIKFLTPEVVVQESVNHRRQALESASGQLKKALKAVAQLGVTEHGPRVDVDKLAKEYEATLRQRLCILGSIEDVPQPDHGDFLRRAVRKSKPFASSGAGYRDALIFESVAQAAQASDVVFITRNHSDFCAASLIDENGALALHPDLVDLLVLRSIPPDRVRVFPDLRAALQYFNDEEPSVWLRDRKVETSEEAFELAVDAHLDELSEHVRNYLLDTWPELGIEVMSPHQVNDMSVIDATNVREFAVEESTTKDGTVVTGTIGARATMTVSVSLYAYFDGDQYPLEDVTASTPVGVRATVEWNRNSDTIKILRVEGPFDGYLEVDG